MSVTRVTTTAHYEHQYPHLKFSVFTQAAIHPATGDCHRTAIGSCLQIDPRTLTNYAECGDDWHMVCLRELAAHGWIAYWVPTDKPNRNQSPTGWMVASVPSKSFKGKWHSVVVDSDLRLIHDPNWNTPRRQVRRSAIRDLLIFEPLPKEDE